MFESLQPFGKSLIMIGIILVLLGILLLISDKIPFLGKLPGDIIFHKKNFTFYFPVASSIIISVVLTLLFYLIKKFK